MKARGLEGSPEMLGPGEQFALSFGNDDGRLQRDSVNNVAPRVGQQQTRYALRARRNTIDGDVVPYGYRVDCARVEPHLARQLLTGAEPRRANGSKPQESHARYLTANARSCFGLV